MKIFEEKAKGLELREPYDALGLSVDMLDVDRLRVWATNVETYGSELSQWGSPGFVVAWIRGLADRLETTVRDIGVLRTRPAVDDAVDPADGAQHSPSTRD